MSEPTRDPEDFTLYFNEERVLAEADTMIRHLHDVAQGVQGLADAYRRSYVEQRRLVRLSDRMQQELQTAKHRLGEQAEDLKKLNDDLRAEAEKRRLLTDELLRMATTDPLTGASTRRPLYDRGAFHMSQFGRNGEPLAALMLDLDHFKKINDTKGHIAGDEVLKHFAEICTALIRKSDTFARYGGEEFVLLLPNTDLATAGEIAERLRATVAESAIATGAGPVTLTISIGVALLQPGDPSLDALIARADEALYEAKRLGRNRVVIGGQKSRQRSRRPATVEPSL